MLWQTAAANGVTDQISLSQVIVAGIALASAALAAWVGARGTLRGVDAARAQAFDKRVDERLARLEERLEAMTADRDRYREQYAQLRVDVRAAGMDPDKVRVPDGR